MTPAQRSHVTRMLRRCSKALDSLDPAVWRPALEQQQQMIDAYQPDKFYVYNYCWLKYRIMALERAARVRREVWSASVRRKHHAHAMENVRCWGHVPGLSDYRGLPK